MRPYTRKFINNNSLESFYTRDSLHTMIILRDIIFAEIIAFVVVSF